MPIEPKVLFVDDEASMREILQLYFRGNGIEVTVVSTGSEAIDMFGQDHYDLTILDLNLASGDSLDVLNFIKGQDSKHPVIIFTGADDNELFLKKHLLDRANAVVRKMSSLSALLTTTRRCLSGDSGMV